MPTMFDKEFSYWLVNHLPISELAVYHLAYLHEKEFRNLDQQKRKKRIVISEKEIDDFEKFMGVKYDPDNIDWNIK